MLIPLKTFYLNLLPGSRLANNSWNLEDLEHILLNLLARQLDREQRIVNLKQQKISNTLLKGPMEI